MLEANEEKKRVEGEIFWTKPRVRAVVLFFDYSHLKKVLGRPPISLHHYKGIAEV